MHIHRHKSSASNPDHALSPWAPTVPHGDQGVSVPRHAMVAVVAGALSLDRPHRLQHWEARNRHAIESGPTLPQEIHTAGATADHFRYLEAAQGDGKRYDAVLSDPAATGDDDSHWKLP